MTHHEGFAFSLVDPSADQPWSVARHSVRLFSSFKTLTLALDSDRKLGRDRRGSVLAQDGIIDAQTDRRPFLLPTVRGPATRAQGSGEIRHFGPPRYTGEWYGMGNRMTLSEAVWTDMGLYKST